MNGKVIKSVVITFGVVLAAAAILFGILMIDWAKSSARAQKDAVIAHTGSPDGQFEAEIHVFTTAMHGGPDTLYIELRQVAPPFAEKIYERTYECSDFSAFSIHWESPHDLTIAYGACNAQRKQTKGIYREFYYKEENKVWRSDTEWQGVNINYIDTKYVAAH